MKIGLLAVFSFLIICFCSCGFQSNKIEWKVIEKDTAMFAEISAKYTIDNKYGTGYILLNDDNTYEHLFNDGDSCYIDSGIWDALKTGNSDQDMPFGGVDVPDGYDVFLRDWYWRFPVDETSNPHEKINESLRYEKDRLSCKNVAFTNAQVDFFKETVHSKKISNYQFSEKDTARLVEDNFIDNCIELGIINIDSVEYNVVSVFRRIEIADGFKGRSFLIFKNDSLNFEKIYETEMPADLPIDVYENNLVFRRENGLFCFDGNIKLEELTLCPNCKSCFLVSE